MAFLDAFPQYVTAAERRRRAEREIADLKKRGVTPKPVVISGRNLAETFWGKAWNENLAAYSDFATRLPRGRSYVRNGAVIHLELSPMHLRALVMGSELYEVKVEVDALPDAKWKRLVKESAGQIGNMVDLLMGRLSPQVMAILTRKDEGLFPTPRELRMSCSCPDVAKLCKHVAAVLYAIGARLDSEPETLFLLRGVDKADLVQASSGALKAGPTGKATIPRAKVAAIFGVELSDDEEPLELPRARPRRKKPAARRRR